jgi:hypothetical protein
VDEPELGCESIFLMFKVTDELKVDDEFVLSIINLLITSDLRSHRYLSAT